QLYKRDFPGFYFPDNFDLFQIFRCPNFDCTEAIGDKSDYPMFHYYFGDSAQNKTLSKPEINLKDAEQEVPDCYLKPIVMDDYPNYDDYENDEFAEIEKKYGEDMAEWFMEKHSAIPRSKFGGYPSYTQSPY